MIGRADTVALTSQNQFGYTQIGHGGDGSSVAANLGTASGSIRLLEVGEVSLRGGNGAAHTMIGHGGYQFGGTARGVAGDQIEIIHPSGNHTVTLEQMRNLDGEAITVAPGSPLQVRIPLEARFAGALIARILPT